jgi:hypothetical protein
LLVVLAQVEVLKAKIMHRLAPAPAPVATAEPAHELTAHEAARYRPALGLKAIRFLTRTGRVPSVQRGRRHLVKLCDLDAYLDDCRRRGVALGMLPGVACAHDPRHRPPDPPRTRTHANRTR